MSAEFVDLYPHPSLSPAPDEIAAPGDPDFAEACRADMAAISKGAIRWDTELFTHSPRWGIIWRADFSEPERAIAISPTRVVRWVTDDGGIGTFVSVGKNEGLTLKQ